jgi:hypothetical protein
MPMKLVKLRSRKGRKFRGINIRAQRSFHCTRVRTPGKSKFNESANRTMSATQAATSSRVNSILVAMRAFWPNEMKATSLKLIKLESRSMHFANNLAVYAVTAAAPKRNNIPISQPE